jgi:hypothetical protein
MFGWTHEILGPRAIARPGATRGVFRISVDLWHPGVVWSAQVMRKGVVQLGEHRGFSLRSCVAMLFGVNRRCRAHARKRDNDTREFVSVVWSSQGTVSLKSFEIPVRIRIPLRKEFLNGLIHDQVQ